MFDRWSDRVRTGSKLRDGDEAAPETKSEQLLRYKREVVLHGGGMLTITDKEAGGWGEAFNLLHEEGLVDQRIAWGVSPHETEYHYTLTAAGESAAEMLRDLLRVCHR